MADIFSTETLLRVSTQMKPAHSFLRSLFVKPSNTDYLLTRTANIDVKKGKRILAPYVSPIIAGKVMKRAGYTTQSIELPYIKEKMITTAEDCLKRAPGQNIYSPVPLQERAQTQLAEDMAYLDETIARREEWQIAQALTTGAADLKGEGVSINIDYGIDDTHKVTLIDTHVWSNAAATPIQDLDDWKALINKDAGLGNVVAIFGREAWKSFRARVTEKDFDLLRADFGTLAPQELQDGSCYMGRLTNPKLDIYTYDEWYIDEETGDEKPLIPENMVILVSRDIDCRMLYGLIVDHEAPGGYGASVARFYKSWLEKDPSARILLAQSSPLFNPVQVDAIVIATVQAAS